MSWWTGFGEQLKEFWQQVLYKVELMTAGADDLPWLDALKFFWDSLPDADKLTTAERRRLAHSVKLLVHQSVQAHYDKEISQKQAIQLRQLRRQQAQAEQHVQQLADKRQAEMQVLSETARQQSRVLPSMSDVAGLLDGLEGLDDRLPNEQQQQVWQEAAQQYQYLQQWQSSRSHSRRQSREHRRQQSRAASQSLPAAAAATAAVVAPAHGDHTVINIQGGSEVIAEIQPASDCSSSSSRSSSPSRAPCSHRQNHLAAAAAGAADDLRQPLLAAAADAASGDPRQHIHYDNPVRYYHHQQQGGYVAPAVLHQQQQQQDTFHGRQQQQDQDVVIDVRPLYSKSSVQSGSQLLLHRYLHGSQPAAATMHGRSLLATSSAPPAVKGPQDSHTEGYSAQRVLHTVTSDVSSDGLDVRTPTYSSGSADQSSATPAPRSSISSSSTAVGTNAFCKAPMGAEGVHAECDMNGSSQGLHKGRDGVAEFVVPVGRILHT